MLDFNGWLNTNTEALAAADRAAAAWRRILDKPSVITILRETVTLPEQTARLEYTSSTIGSEYSGGAGTSGHQSVIVFGIQGHPSESDTDIQRGDLFTADGKQFRVINVISTIGEIQAMCEALS